MKVIKGCVNKECISYEKRTIYKETDESCSKCGDKLQYVCKMCFKQFEDGTQKYCDVCLAERSDIRQKIIKNGKIALGVIAGLFITGWQLNKHIDNK